MAELVIPIGEENFAAFRESGGYYIDKTDLIVKLLQDQFANAFSQLAYNISSLCVEHAYLLESEKVNEGDRKRLPVR